MLTLNVVHVWGRSKLIMKSVVDKYPIEETDDTFIQFFRYIFAGGLAAIVDIGIFMLLAKIFHTLPNHCIF